MGNTFTRNSRKTQKSTDNGAPRQETAPGLYSMGSQADVVFHLNPKISYRAKKLPRLGSQESMTEGSKSVDNGADGMSWENCNDFPRKDMNNNSFYRLDQRAFSGAKAFKIVNDEVVFIV